MNLGEETVVQLDPGDGRPGLYTRVRVSDERRLTVRIDIGVGPTNKYVYLRY